MKEYKLLEEYSFSIGGGVWEGGYDFQVEKYENNYWCFMDYAETFLVHLDNQLELGEIVVKNSKNDWEYIFKNCTINNKFYHTNKWEAFFKKCRAIEIDKKNYSFDENLLIVNEYKGEEK